MGFFTSIQKQKNKNPGCVFWYKPGLEILEVSQAQRLYLNKALGIALVIIS